VIDEKFWAYLHDRVGRCGHCGGAKCPDRRKWSVLPDRIATDLVVEAAKAAAEEEAESVADESAEQPGGAQ
jgi:hypothetical protein